MGKVGGGYKGAVGKRVVITLGALVRRLREQLGDGAWQGAHITRALILVHDFFPNEIQAHTAQMCFCAELHELVSPFMKWVNPPPNTQRSRPSLNDDPSLCAIFYTAGDRRSSGQALQGRDIKTVSAS